MVTAAQNEYLTRVGPGSPMGLLFRRYWLPALLAEELPEPDCAPVRVKLLGERLLAFRDTQGTAGADRRILRPSRREPVVRPQRGKRHPLPLPRLEVRRDRAMRRRPLRAGGKRLLFQDQAHELSPDRARRRAVGLSRPARTQAGGARLRLDAGGARPALRLQARPGIQLSAGNGGRRRFDPFGLPASLLGRRRSPAQARSGEPRADARRYAPRVPADTVARRPSRGDPPQRRRGPVLLARHAMAHAVLQLLSPVRRQPPRRPRVRADR